MELAQCERIIKHLEQAAELLKDPRAANLLRTDPAELYSYITDLREALEKNKRLLAADPKQGTLSD